MKRYDMFGVSGYKEMLESKSGAWVKYEDVVIRTQHHTDTINIISEISFNRRIKIEEIERELAKLKGETT